uniref:EamA domain-containing protein n=1 Tax=Setaria italica TaxID=4555 RepID=K3YNW8_SETIT
MFCLSYIVSLRATNQVLPTAGFWSLLRYMFGMFFLLFGKRLGELHWCRE